jgi:hypothetical protein
MMRWFVFFAAVLAVASTTFAENRVIVGICPFYDDTGTVAGERAGSMLPVLFLEKGQKAPFVPVIVNPGPDVVPGDGRWPAEVARSMGLDAVVIGRVQALAMEKGGKPNENALRGHVLLSSHAARLILTASLLEASNGHELATLSAEEMVKGPWLEEAAARFTVLGTAIHHEAFWFSDSQFGKAITRSAERIMSDLSPPLSNLVSHGDHATAPTGQTCHVTIRVIYKDKNRSSKMYLAAVNGKEESFGIDDGLLNLNLPSGPLLLHITVKDPPFRQPVQASYYANSDLDCSRPQQSLAFEIGDSGEGVIHWQ